MSNVFPRWFGVAVVAHVVGNWGQPDFPHPIGVVNLLVGLVGLVIIARPTRLLLLLVASLTVVSVILEMPFTGNHWVVAGLAGLGILLGGGRFEAFAPALRVIFLVFYAFAAFSKLNSAFFDPTVSCAVFYANQTLDGFGLGQISSSSPAAAPLIWLTAMIELSVVPLLLVRRTRRFGVLIAATFHIAISFDLNQHFYDFSAVLLALLLLFLPEESKSLRSERRSRAQMAIQAVAVCLGALLVAVASFPMGAAGLLLLRSLPFFAWAVACAAWLRVVAQIPREPWSLNLRPSWGTGAVVLIALLNGLTPYFEVKTAYSFNMYSNLVTAQGETNHFIVPRTLPLRDAYAEPIEVLSSTDSGLDQYRQHEYALPVPELERYAAGTAIGLAAKQGGIQLSISGRDLDRPEWWEVWLPLRSLDLTEPARCQDAFLPAL